MHSPRIVRVNSQFETWPIGRREILTRNTNTTIATKGKNKNFNENGKQLCAFQAKEPTTKNDPKKKTRQHWIDYEFEVTLKNMCYYWLLLLLALMHEQSCSHSSQRQMHNITNIEPHQRFHPPNVPHQTLWIHSPYIHHTPSASFIFKYDILKSFMCIVSIYFIFIIPIRLFSMSMSFHVHLNTSSFGKVSFQNGKENRNWSLPLRNGNEKLIVH